MQLKSFVTEGKHSLLDRGGRVDEGVPTPHEPAPRSGWESTNNDVAVSFRR